MTMTAMTIYFVTYWGQNVLYHNNGDGTFTDVTEKAGLLIDRNTLGRRLCVFDYDRDGHLDFSSANYVDLDLKTAPLPGTGACLFQGMAVNCGPQGLPRAKNYLFHNNGDGTFTDVRKRAASGKLRPAMVSGSWLRILTTTDGRISTWPMTAR